MKAAFAAMCGVLVLSLMVCAASAWVQGNVLDDMDILCISALECVRREDGEAARGYVDSLERLMDDKRGIMESLASHNDLHETATCIVDARVALECGDIDDAYQALVRLQGMLEHLRVHESLSLSNIL